MTGRDYWRMVLSPYARDGYRRGVLDDYEVVLVNEVDGNEVHLSRPQAGWLPASLVVPALDAEDLDSEELRGIVYVMGRGRERQELSA